MAEEWRPVVGYEGCYEVSCLGRVRSLARMVKRGTHLLPISAKLKALGLSHGYPTVQLYKENERWLCHVHILVAAAFIGPCPAGQQVRHYDGIRKNCVSTNLLYGTPVQNFEDSIRHVTDTRWHRNSRALLSPEAIRHIKHSGSRGVDLAAKFGVAQQTICNVRKGRRYAGVP